MSKEYPEEVKLYDHVSNSGIVHMPGRRFPAVAIQGDSLSYMLTTALELMEKGKQLQDEDIYYGSMELAERLRDHLAHYEEILDKEGFEKPYTIIANKLNTTDDFDNS